MSLAHWLHSGDDLKTWNQTARGHAHPLCEGWWWGPGSGQVDDWTWNEYYAQTSRDFGGAEICDCWRDSCHPTCSPQSFFSNRYYRLREGAWTGRLTYVASMGQSLRPRWHALDAAAWTLRCGAHPLQGVSKRCSRSTPAAHDLAGTTRAEMLDAVASRFAPDALLVHLTTNWEAVTNSEDAAREGRPAPRSTCEYARGYMQTRLPDAGRPAEAHRPAEGPHPLRRRPHILWNDLDTGNWTAQSANTIIEASASSRCAGGLGSADETKPSQLVLAPLLVARLLLELPRADVFVDKAHFQPWVYHELSQLLLNALEHKHNIR